MKKLTAMTVFTLLLIPAFGIGQGFEKLKVYEELPNGERREILNGDWIHEDRDILIEYPRDRLVWIVVTENESLIKSAEVRSFITLEGRTIKAMEEPYRVRVKFQKETGVGLGRDGQEVEITAFKNTEEGKYVYDGSRKFKIYKPGFKLRRADSVNATPLFIYESGKKVKPGGEKTNGLNAGVGGTLLFFIVTSRLKWLAHLGFGPDLYYTNTEVLEEGAVEAENRNVANGGLTVAVEIPADQKIYLLLVVGRGGLNVSGGRYNYFGVGITTPFKF